MRSLIGDEIPLEGGHLRLVEENTVWSAPEVEEIVDTIVAFFRVGVTLEGRADQHAGMVHQVLSAIFLTIIQFHLFQGTVGVERTGCMEQQVMVHNGVHASMREDQLDVLAQFLVHRERVVEPFHKVILFGCERYITVVSCDGGEATGGHGILLPIHLACTFLKIHGTQQVTVLHAPLGVLVEDLGLHLELENGDGLVHHRGETRILLIEFLATASGPRHELRTRVIAVGLHGEGSQGHQVNTVCLLKGGKVCVSQTETDNVADTCVVSCAGTHPENVVITPLDIPVFVLPQ